MFERNYRWAHVLNWAQNKCSSRFKGGMVKRDVLDGHIVQRQTPSLPHIVDAQSLAAVLLLLKGLFVRLVDSIFLEVSERNYVNAEEPPVRWGLTRPNETLIPTGGAVYGSNGEPCPSINRRMFLTACSA